MTLLVLAFSRKNNNFKIGPETKKLSVPYVVGPNIHSWVHGQNVFFALEDAIYTSLSRGHILFIAQGLLAIYAGSMGV